MPTHSRSRRSCLSVPGSSTKMLSKAAGLLADEILIDLEDSVPPDVKGDARGNVIAALLSENWVGKTVAVRINAVSTQWCHEDVISILEEAGNRLDCVLVPKVEDATEVSFIHHLLSQLEQKLRLPSKVGVEVQIETARGLTNVDSIVAACDRIETLSLGRADMSASLGLPSATTVEAFSGRRELWESLSARLLLAAKSGSIQAIDGPHAEIHDLEGLEQEARQARDLGYDGKWALHPSHLPILNDVFTPAPEEVKRAKELIEAYNHAKESGGQGAVMFGNEMIDEATKRMAEQVVERAKAAAS